MWSDGCENRNITVANAYSELSRQHGVVITQKYLVAGHTQMECDSMHSAIERRLKLTDVFTFRDYVMILQTARVRPAPYHVAEVKHDEVLKMSASYFSSIRPGKKIGDLKVHDLRAIQYTDDGQVYFKLSFSDKEWSLMPQRQQITAVEVE